MLNNLSERTNAQATLSRPESVTCAIASTGSTPTDSVILEESRTLPYQADQQAEFLDLQAETEALLNQLQLLKQRRLGSVPLSATGAAAS